jgi:hypothetical protein
MGYAAAAVLASHWAWPTSNSLSRVANGPPEKFISGILFPFIVAAVAVAVDSASPLAQRLPGYSVFHSLRVIADSDSIRVRKLRVLPL